MSRVTQNKTPPLSDCVSQSLRTYFEDLHGIETNNLYNLVISEVEKPLLKIIMIEAKGNQLKASRMLGINRNTLRKKLLKYGIK